jgi:putative proteasome-type protease
MRRARRNAGRFACHATHVDAIATLACAPVSERPRGECTNLDRPAGTALLESGHDDSLQRKMTYCVGMSLETGMVFASDSRTNAGVDQVSRFSKMRCFVREGDRVIVSLSSGNLSITQNAVNIVEQRAKANDARANVWNVTSMGEVARLFGDALREVKSRDGPYLMQNNIDAGANFIVGGQVRGEPPRLFNIYSEGNFIEASVETCYFQTGETKYGKPIIDRVITRQSDLTEAVKCTLVSFDSTMRSNISVGLPIDLLTYRTDTLRVNQQRRIEENDAYFSMIHRQWADGLRKVFRELPDPQW